MPNEQSIQLTVPTDADGTPQATPADRETMISGLAAYYHHTLHVVEENPYDQAWRDGQTVGEHRAIMSDMLGAPIPQGMIVHHRDGNRRNNNPDNLALMTSSGHLKHHHCGRKNTDEARWAISIGSQLAGTGKIFTREQVETMRSQVKAGHTVAEVARVWGIDSLRVKRLLAGTSATIDQ